MNSQCPNCKEENSNYLFDVFDPVDIHNESHHVRFKLFECKNCFVRFKAPYYSKEELDVYYYNLPVGTWSWEVKPEIKNLFEVRKQIIAKYLTEGSVLDVGCFNGNFLNYLGDSYTRFGLEPSDVPMAKGVEKIHATLEDYNSEGKKYDLVVLTDVIEHIQDPTFFLEKIDSLVENDGYILIDTGDYSSNVSRLLGDTWGYYHMIGHCMFYDRRSLEKLLIDKGYMVLDVTKTTRYAFSLKFFLYALMYKIFKLVCKYTQLYRIEILGKYYFHSSNIFFYNDHILVFAKKVGSSK